MNKPYTLSELQAVIKKALEPSGLWSKEAEQLLLATCANESHFGEYRHQVGGPAVGIYQEEALDYNDLINHYVVFNAEFKALVGKHTFADLVNDDEFATLICRLHYFRIPHPLPAADDLDGIWNYYKIYYNSVYGAATKPEFVANYNKYVLGEANQAEEVTTPVMEEAPAPAPVVEETPVSDEEDRTNEPEEAEETVNPTDE